MEKQNKSWSDKKRRSTEVVMTKIKMQMYVTSATKGPLHLIYALFINILFSVYRQIDYINQVAFLQHVKTYCCLLNHRKRSGYLEVSLYLTLSHCSDTFCCPRS